MSHLMHLWWGHEQPQKPLSAEAQVSRAGDAKTFGHSAFIRVDVNINRKWFTQGQDDLGFIILTRYYAVYTSLSHYFISNSSWRQCGFHVRGIRPLCFSNILPCHHWKSKFHFIDYKSGTYRNNQRICWRNLQQYSIVC